MKNKLFLTFAIILVASKLMAQLPNNAALKLRVGTYNVGHFNQGRQGGYQDTTDHAIAEMTRWRTWIGQQSLDFFSVNEWNKNFDKDSTINAQDALLKPYYSNIYFGTRGKWIYNGIATNYQLTNIRQKQWFWEYYAIIGDLRVGNKTVTVISTHIPWQKQWHTAALEAFLSELKKYEYVICMGDINANDAEQLHFQQAGFNIANGGNLGWFGTSSGPNIITGRANGANTSIDNIITSKNIKIMNVSAPRNGLNDLDHLPIMADVIVSW